jgi:hypothetical protein
MHPTLTAKPYHDSTVHISGRCVVTGKYWSVMVPRKGFNAWRDGTLIQEALPGLSKEDREFLQTGISPEGWSIKFPPKTLEGEAIETLRGILEVAEKGESDALKLIATMCRDLFTEFDLKEV